MPGARSRAYRTKVLVERLRRLALLVTKVKRYLLKRNQALNFWGALFEDTNTFWGVIIKYSETSEAQIPPNTRMMRYFRSCTFHRQSAYLLGRDRPISTIPTDHPSCSKQHAVFQYWLVEYTCADHTIGRRVMPYIIDLVQAMEPS